MAKCSLIPPGFFAIDSTRGDYSNVTGRLDLAPHIRLGIKPFAELGANSEALSGSQLHLPCSCKAIFESAPVAMLQSRTMRG